MIGLAAVMLALSAATAAEAGPPDLVLVHARVWAGEALAPQASRREPDR